MRGRLDVVDKAIRKRGTIINITVPGIMADNDANRYARKKAEIEKSVRKKIRIYGRSVILRKTYNNSSTLFPRYTSINVLI